MKKCDIVVAGHICLDITPKFLDAGPRPLAEILRPGTLTQVGECVVSGGGPVANTGVALRRLGMDVVQMGKVGDDAFGEALIKVLQGHGCGEGVLVVPGEQTSYTIVLAPPHIDRMFLHNAGANDTFAADDVDYDVLDGARAFHLGYPPLMARLYEDDGAQLVEIFRRAKERGVTTSLDMTLPDPEASSGKVDWPKVFEATLPWVDLFVPSGEEMFFCLERERFLELSARAHARGMSPLDLMTAADYARLSHRLLDYGAGVVTLKSGHRGVYVRSGGADRLERFGRAECGDVSEWAGREMWEPAYHIDRVASATGSGDCAIAGFLAAFMNGCSLADALRYATAAGYQNVTVYDAVSGILSWEETTAMLDTTPKAPLELEGEGWRRDQERGTWHGPARA